MKKILLFISIFLFFNSTNAMVRGPRSCEEIINFINEKVTFDMLRENGLNTYFDIKLVFNKMIHEVFAKLLNNIDPNHAYNCDLAKNFLNDLIKMSIIILNTDSDFNDFQKKFSIYIAQLLENGKIKKIINSFIADDLYRKERVEHYSKIFEYFALFVLIKNGRNRVRF